MARDRIHNAVVQALKNDGWTIIKELDRIEYQGKLFEFDIQAKKDEAARTIEVKSFIATNNDIQMFNEALGQYILYREILAQEYPERELYLAISREAYERVFLFPLCQQIVHAQQMKLLIITLYDNNTGEVFRWIP